MERTFTMQTGGIDERPERAGVRTYRDGTTREVWYLEDGRKVVRWCYAE